jgi:hypothetical protein
MGILEFVTMLVLVTTVSRIIARRRPVPLPVNPSIWTPRNFTASAKPSPT